MRYPDVREEREHHLRAASIIIRHLQIFARVSSAIVYRRSMGVPNK